MLDSIRIKLTLWYAGVLTLLVVIFSVLTFFFVQNVLSQEIDSNLLGMSLTFETAVNSEINTEKGKITDEEAISEVTQEFRFKDYQLSIFSSDGRLIAKTFDQNFKADITKNSYQNFDFEGQQFRVFSSVLRLSDTDYKLLIYRNIFELNKVKTRITYIFLIIIPLIVLPTVLLGYWLAKRSLKPVSEMSRQAKTISADNLNLRLKVINERDEIGDLTGVINDLLGRLENSFEQQKRFVADASHELRTPLAIVRGESEIALSKEDRPNKDLRESLAIVHDESKRLTKIVEDLFTLSRVDAGQFKTNFKPVYLDEILNDCVRKLRSLASKKDVSMEIEAEETEILGDDQLLQRLFLNLFDNAVKYNRNGGKIKVKLIDRIVTVSDTGFEIAAEEQSKIFDRFYRTDRSRSRTTESLTSGAGLGLSIAKWIADIHHAELRLVKSDESGNIFSVSFPC